MTVQFILGVIAGTCFGGLIYSFLDWAYKKYLQWKQDRALVKTKTELGKAAQKVMQEMESKLNDLGAQASGKTLMGQPEAKYAEQVKQEEKLIIETLTIPVARTKTGRFKKKPKKK